MAFNLHNRHFLKLDDFTPQEIAFLLHLSAELKAAKYAGTEEPRLKGKQIVLIPSSIFGYPVLLALGREKWVPAGTPSCSIQDPLRGAVFSRNGKNCWEISPHRVVARVQFPFETAYPA